MKKHNKIFGKAAAGDGVTDSRVKEQSSLPRLQNNKSKSCSYLSGKGDTKISTVVYISSYRGKVKDGSRYFNKITVACIVKDKPARVMDLFSKDGEKLAGQDELKFGDVLELDYVESDYPGG